MPANPSSRHLIRAAHCLIAFMVVGTSAITTSLIGASSSSATTPSLLPWVQQSPTTSPTPTSAGSMAYDPATGQMVLLGGFGADNETWTYDGTTWTHQTPSTSPLNGTYASMAYDPTISKIVLLTHDDQGSSTETWTWDGTTWTQLSPITSPPFRWQSSMAYDPTNGQLVLFGGRSGSGNPLADTWTFDGTTWTQQSPTVSPPARSMASMAYDPSTSQVVLFGGIISTDNNTGFSIFGDTWTYDGTTWTEQSPSTNPANRYGASMAYDPALGEMMLFGGGNNTTALGGRSLGGTWTYEDSAWTQQSPSTSPPARNTAQMAYDEATSQMILEGGFTDAGGEANDTWAYPGSSQAIAFTSTAPAQGIRGGTTYSPTATSGSGLDVTLSLDANSTGCSFDGAVVTFTGAGTCVVDANQSGNDQFAPAAQVQQSIDVTSPGPYSPIDPVRICDTRAGNPSNLTGEDAQCNGLTVPTAGTRTINVANGSFGVPADATAVVLNVTAVNPTAAGFVTVYPTGAPLPNASSLNYNTGNVVPNLVEVGIGSAGQVSIYSSAQTDVVVDVEGYTSPTASEGSGAGLYNPLSSPARICDTRAVSSFTSSNQCDGPGSAPGTLTAGGTKNVAVTNGSTIPSGAIAVVLNVTVVNPKLEGYLSVYPQGSGQPNASNVNYAAGQTITNRVIVPLSTGGGITVWSSESTDVVVDVSGYYSAAGGTGTQFTAEPAPVRTCDTRPVTSYSPLNRCTDMPIGGGNANVLTLKVPGTADIPADATAVVVNLTGVSDQSTFLSVYPGPGLPATSDLNIAANGIKANMVVATINPNTGDISIFDQTGSTNVIVDVLGWYS
jgi:hypothetical protein